MVRPDGVASRRLLVAGCLLALGIATAAGVAAAHGNHAVANSQASANGSLVVEQLFLSEPGYLVVRADDDGTPGRVLGYRALGVGLRTGVTVSIADDEWAAVSQNTTVWTVLHADNGDGQFDPETDPLLQWFDQPAGDRITVGKRSSPAYVVAGNRSADDELTIRQAALPEAGHLVAHRTANGSLGRVLGSRSLSAGHHSDVRVPVNASSTPADRASLSVAVYTDDGDGTFDVDDSVVRVGDHPVASQYGRQRTQSSDSAPAIVTPTDSTTTSDPAQTPTDSQSSPTSTVASGPGFDAGTVVMALLLVLGTVVAASRRA